MAAWDPLGVFTFMWAQIMVLQVIKLLHPLMASAQPWRLATLFWPALMGCTCLLGVLLPHKTWATLQLLLVSLAVLQFTGSQSNHIFMAMAVCLAVLSTFSWDRARWQAQATCSVRAFLVVLYAVTALHKMNKDWDDASRSCSTLMLGGVFALSPLRPLLHLVPMVWVPRAAVLTELVLPVLLLISGRCLRVAAVLGCGFHLALCQMLPPMSVYPFSLLMAPPYVFVIPERSAALLDCLRPWVVVLVPCFAVLCRQWTAFVADDLEPGQQPFEYPPYGAWAGGVVWCNMALLLLMCAAVWPLQSSHLGQPAKPRPTIGCGMVVLTVLLLGLCPYLGLRNHPSLAMFSNLRTEGGRGNHLFLGDDFDLLGWQRDYVTVHETDIPALQLAQVDLAPLFTPATHAALQSYGIVQEFWIAPPLRAWPHPPTREFRPYSMPYLELRRRLAPLAAAKVSSGHVRYSRTRARAQLRWPRLWELLGLENLPADVVQSNLTYDLSLRSGSDSSGERDRELERLLPWWQEPLARFRTFDVADSPCRH